MGRAVARCVARAIGPAAERGTGIAAATRRVGECSSARTLRSPPIRAAPSRAPMSPSTSRCPRRWRRTSPPACRLASRSSSAPPGSTAQALDALREASRTIPILHVTQHERRRERAARPGRAGRARARTRIRRRDHRSASPPQARCTLGHRAQARRDDRARARRRLSKPSRCAAPAQGFASEGEIGFAVVRAGDHRRRAHRVVQRKRGAGERCRTAPRTG